MASANIQGQNLLSRFQRSNNSDDTGNDTDNSGGGKLPAVPVLQNVAAAAAARQEMVANHQRLLSRAAVGGRGISVRVPGEACHSDGVVVAAPS